MTGKYTVNPGELDAASGHVLGLFDDTKSLTRSVTQTLGQLASAAGHPDVQQALVKVTSAAEKAMLDTASALEFVGSNLKDTAKEYERIEQENAKVLRQHAGRE